MRLLILVLVVCGIVGCFQQGVKGVYYVSVETESLDVDGDGIQDGITVFLVFRNRNFEEVSFYDAECTAKIRVYGEGLVYEKEVSFDSSGGSFEILSEEAGMEYGDISVVVRIEGRGEFRSEKKNVRLRG